MEESRILERNIAKFIGNIVLDDKYPEDIRGEYTISTYFRDNSGIYDDSYYIAVDTYAIKNSDEDSIERSYDVYIENNIIMFINYYIGSFIDIDLDLNDPVHYRLFMILTHSGLFEYPANNTDCDRKSYMCICYNTYHIIIPIHGSMKSIRICINYDIYPYIDHMSYTNSTIQVIDESKYDIKYPKELPNLVYYLPEYICELYNDIFKDTIIEPIMYVPHDYSKYIYLKDDMECISLYTGNTESRIFQNISKTEFKNKFGDKALELYYTLGAGPHILPEKFANGDDIIIVK